MTATMTQRAIARVAYNGEGLRTGAMDVRELAPALLAVGDLLERSNHVLNGDRAKLSVMVRSDFEVGSFEIVFELAQSLATQTHMFISGEQLKSAKEIAEFVGLIVGGGGGLYGLLELIKFLRGKSATEGTTLQNGNIQIKIEGNNNHVEVRPEVFQLANDQETRKAASAVMKPLTSHGIDRFEVRSEGHVTAYGREDLPAFAPPRPVEQEITNVDTEQTVALEVIKPSFEDGLTWMFSDGSGGRVSATMKDDGFVDRIQRRELAFSKGTILRLVMRSKRYATGTGLRTENEVVRVLDTINQPRPIALPLADPDNPDSA